mmetsp:Transcript_50611/g.114966  ORF Transcript_50611/g.114966 Transcript_50611/m.114966 type:complete len:596 (+) Transcript_50611:474-2261(+)
MDAGGMVSGTAKDPLGLTSFTVTASNDGGTLTVSFSLQITNAPPSELVYPDSGKPAFAGEVVLLKPRVTGEGLRYSVQPALPSGLSLDPRTGVLSGTPDDESTETLFTISVENDGGSSSVQLPLAVGPPRPLTLSYPPPEGAFEIGDAVALSASVSRPVAASFSVFDRNGGNVDLGAFGLELGEDGSITGTAMAPGMLALKVVIKVGDARAEATLTIEIKKPEVVVVTKDSISQDFMQSVAKETSLEGLRRIRPEQKKNFGNWMVWMVHRVWLDDPDLSELSFAGKQMPDPASCSFIAPKLVDALKTNTHLEILLLQDSNLHKSSGLTLADSLEHNHSLRIVNVEQNKLDSEVARRIGETLLANQSCKITEIRLGNQRTGAEFFGRPVEEAFGELMNKNTTILKLGMLFNDAHWRDQVSRKLMRNNDEARRKRALARAGEKVASPTLRTTQVVFSKLLVIAAGSEVTSDAPKFTPDQALAGSMIWEYVLEKGVCPTDNQVKSFASSRGQSLPFKASREAMAAFRLALPAMMVGSTVKAGDVEGVVTAWKEDGSVLTCEVRPSAGDFDVAHCRSDDEIKVQVEFRSDWTKAARGSQ